MGLAEGQDDGGLNDGDEDVLKQDDGEPEDTTVEEAALDGALQNSRLVAFGVTVRSGDAVALDLQLLASLDGATLGEVLQVPAGTLPVQQEFFLVVAPHKFFDAVLFSAAVEDEDIPELEAVRESSAKRPEDAFEVGEGEEGQVCGWCRTRGRHGHGLGYVQSKIPERKFVFL